MAESTHAKRTIIDTELLCLRKEGVNERTNSLLYNRYDIIYNSMICHLRVI